MTPHEVEEIRNVVNRMLAAGELSGGTPLARLPGEPPACMHLMLSGDGTPHGIVIARDGVVHEVIDPTLKGWQRLSFGPDGTPVRP